MRVWHVWHGLLGVQKFSRKKRISSFIRICIYSVCCMSSGKSQVLLSARKSLTFTLTLLMLVLNKISSVHTCNNIKCSNFFIVDIKLLNSKPSKCSSICRRFNRQTFFLRTHQNCPDLCFLNSTKVSFQIGRHHQCNGTKNAEFEFTTKTKWVNGRTNEHIRTGWKGIRDSTETGFWFQPSALAILAEFSPLILVIGTVNNEGHT